MSTLRKSRSLTDIVEDLVRDVRRLKARPLNERLVGRVDGSSLAVNTSKTDLVEMQLDIPSNWTAWDLDVFWSMRLVDGSGGNTGISTLVTVSIELDGLTMPGTQNVEVTDSNIIDTFATAGIGWAEDRTTTGIQTVTLVASRAGSPTVNAFGVRLRAEAIRTS
jgi:hypothetical protein